MHGVIVTILLASVTLDHAKELAVAHPGDSTDSMDKLTDMLVDDLSARVLKASSLRHLNMDDTIFGKPGHVAVPRRTNLGPPRAQPLYRQATPDLHKQGAMMPQRWSQWTPSPKRSQVVAHAEGESEDDIEERLKKLGGSTDSAGGGFGETKTKDSEVATAPAPAPDGPEVVFYDGKPAITETILPTLSIITLFGAIPAAAAWSRQAWVKFKISNIGIVVTGGFGGKDEQRFKYADVQRFRCVGKLFGDGDFVFFLKKNQMVELRHVPNWAKTKDFIFDNLPKPVQEEYVQFSQEEWRISGTMDSGRTKTDDLGKEDKSGDS